MNRDEAKALLPMMQSTTEAMRAFADGKTVQYGSDGPGGGWTDIHNPRFQADPDSGFYYRIKPEPRLRAWKPEEAPRVFVVVSRDGQMCVATTNGATVVVVGHSFHHEYDLESMRDHWTRINPDGSPSPCGVLES